MTNVRTRLLEEIVISQWLFVVENETVKRPFLLSKASRSRRFFPGHGAARSKRRAELNPRRLAIAAITRGDRERRPVCWWDAGPPRVIYFITLLVARFGEIYRRKGVKF